MIKLTKEMLAAAMQCKTAGELVEQAKSKGYDITQEQAEAYLEQFSSYELTDEELENISASKNNFWNCTDYVFCEMRSPFL